jgi:hypothetical protein
MPSDENIPQESLNNNNEVFTPISQMKEVWCDIMQAMRQTLQI